MKRPIQLVALLAVVGCASPRAASDQGTQHAAQSAPAGHGMPGGMAGLCPAEVPDTRVAASDTPNGGAITFTTSAANVDEVRRRAHAMADMHNQHHGAAAADAPAGGQHGMMAGMMPPPSHAVAEDVDGGARISVTPDAPADLEKLRSTMRMHAEHMQGGRCGMMGGQM
jgi:hypothetical protein